MSGRIGYAAEPVIRAPRGPDDHIPWHADVTVGVPLEQALSAASAPASEAVHVVINHGRWVVNCPACGGAQLGCPTDPRFMCNECANLAVGGLWRPVVWPKEAAEIAALIAARADATAQNYDPGETLAELREQNSLLESGELATATDLRYIPGADTDEEVPGGASDWEGHTHHWPKKIEPDQDYVCPECGEDFPGFVLLMDREPKGGKA